MKVAKVAVATGAGAERAARLIGLACAFGLFGCVACDEGATRGSDAGAAGSGACLPALKLDCQPAFQPTFPMIFDNLLIKTCGAPSTGGSCHGPSGAKGGLELSNRDRAYELLLGQSDGRARVVPGNPECSLVVRRLEASDANFRMPPGSSQLSEGVRCAVRQWIANGASQQ